ncbi:MAG: hypothetical protein KIT00_12320 [Rhodospirillales bacterium]|nr:hypothetical protein [Rhodospirillales bacterium]
MFLRGTKARGGLSAAAAAAAAVVTAVLASNANATTVSFTLDQQFFGAGTPQGTLSATFSDVATDTVLLTMDATALTGPAGVSVGRWWFNSAIDPTGFTFTYQGTSTGPDVKATNGLQTAFNPTSPDDQFRPDQDGYFDILFNFTKTGDASQTFDPGEAVSFLVEGSGITAETFNLLSDHSAQGAGSNGPFRTVARLTNFPTGNDSAFLGTDQATVTTNVAQAPVPGAVWLFGTSLASLGFLRRRIARS